MITPNRYKNNTNKDLSIFLTSFNIILISPFSKFDKLSIPKLSATDDDSISSTYILLEKPNGAIEMLTEESIVLDITGNYRITFCAYDRSGNCARKTIEFVVI